MNQFESDWTQFEELTPFLKTGEVKYLPDTTDKFSTIVKSFPILAYRIDWRVKENIFLIVKRSEAEFKNYTSEFIRVVLNVLGIPENERFDVVFDGFTEGGINISASILRDFGFTFLLTSQHTYIIPNDYRWCINYSFEGQLHFGFSGGDHLDELVEMKKMMQASGVVATIRGASG